MAKKYRLLYLGTGPGQAAEIERAGYLFIRDTITDVPKEVYDLLKDEDGFSAGKAPTKEGAESEE